jgi:hypothetical protein
VYDREVGGVRCLERAERDPAAFRRKRRCDGGRGLVDLEELPIATKLRLGETDVVAGLTL